MIRVGVKTYQNSNHGDAVGFPNFGLLELTNTAVSPKKYLLEKSLRKTSQVPSRHI